MKEYIEKEALQTSLQRKKSGIADRRYTEGWNDCMMRVKSMVHSAKAADVAPVVHGKWAYIGGDEWCCSHCGFVASTEGRWEPMVAKFCEECGARMEGE